METMVSMIHCQARQPKAGVSPGLPTGKALTTSYSGMTPSADYRSTPGPQALTLAVCMGEA